jgi:hypothetical protein
MQASSLLMPSTSIHPYMCDRYVQNSTGQEQKYSYTDIPSERTRQVSCLALHVTPGDG